VIATKRLYVTADRSRIVDESDPTAAYLLCAAGVEIPREAVERYGLAKNPETKPEPAPTPAEGVQPETRQTRPARGVRTR